MRNDRSGEIVEGMRRKSEKIDERGKAKWFALGREVNFEIDIERVGLRPQKKDFKGAAKKLGISMSDAERAWHVYTWDMDAPDKEAPKAKNIK